MESGSRPPRLGTRHLGDLALNSMNRKYAILVNMNRLEYGYVDTVWLQPQVGGHCWTLETVWADQR